MTVLEWDRDENGNCIELPKMYMTLYEFNSFFKILARLGNKTTIHFGKAVCVVNETGDEESMFQLIAPEQWLTKDLL